MLVWTTIAITAATVAFCSAESPLVAMCRSGDFSNTNPQLEEVGGSRPQCILKNRGDGHWFASPETATVVPQSEVTYVADPEAVFKLQLSEVSPGVSAYVMTSSPNPAIIGGVAILAASESKMNDLPVFVPIVICKDQQPAATFVKFFGVPSAEDIRVLQSVFDVPATEELIKPCVAAASIL